MNSSGDTANTLLKQASKTSTNIPVLDISDAPDVTVDKHTMDIPTDAPHSPDDVDDDWEEWDGRSPFWMHCVAGSLAGVVEHTAVYPLDTVRTHIQVCASCLRNPAFAAAASSKAASANASAGLHAPFGASHSKQLPTGMWQTIRYLTRQQAQPITAAANAATTAPLTRASAAAASAASAASNASSSSTSTSSVFTNVQNQLHGYTRLFRGVQTILIGCIPAHALYFSSYEVVKAAFTDTDTGQVSATGSLLAGAAAVLCHDWILTPLDTMKQRMQLGYYQGGMGQAFTHIVRQEGGRALYRSFPITLATNIPYGMVMVSVNEAAKQAWHRPDVPAWQTVLWSSSVAGCLAATVTTPLDRIKTSLQTQQLVPACHGSQPNCPVLSSESVKLSSWHSTVQHIYHTEGVRGFFRGMVPRLLSHTPAAAISWTTYETAKHYLLQHYEH
jgi:solute carrier family 25 iron transporter 28/37